MVKVQASRRKFHLLYKTTCLETGRYYIGIHSTDEVEDGYLGSGVRLTRSVKKYGRQAHKQEVLEILPDRNALKLREEQVVTDELIASDELCMNLIKGGNSNDREFGVTEETRRRLSEKSKAFVRTKEHYEKAVATRKANGSYRHTDETKRKIGEQFKGKTITDEHKAKISSSNLGRVVTKEIRAKIGLANSKPNLKLRGHTKSPETIEKLRQAQIGRVYSDEARVKMSEKAKARFSGNAHPKSLQCTIDGVRIFNSIKDLIRALGKGKNGLKHPEFKLL